MTKPPDRPWTVIKQCLCSGSQSTAQSTLEKCFIIHLDYVPSPYSNFTQIEFCFSMEKFALLCYFVKSLCFSGIIRGPCMNNKNEKSTEPWCVPLTWWLSDIKHDTSVPNAGFFINTFFMGLSYNVSIELPSAAEPSATISFRRNDNCNSSPLLSKHW